MPLDSIQVSTPEEDDFFGPTDEIPDTLQRVLWDHVSNPAGQLIRYRTTDGLTRICFVERGDIVPLTLRDYIDYFSRKADAQGEEFGGYIYNRERAEEFNLSEYNDSITIEGNIYLYRPSDIRNKAEESKPLDENIEIELYTKKKALVKDSINIRGLGWVLKTDENLKEDYYSKKAIFVNEKYSRKLYQQFCVIYTEIDSKGILSNPQYTAMFPNLPMLVHQGIYEDKLTGAHFCTLELLKDAKFNYYFKENLNDGKFYMKGSFNEKQLVKSNKTQYRKSKRFKSFRSSIINKPNTYIKMLGKKYTFGLEIETSSGFLPKYLDEFIYYDAVHDGSLRDAEGHTYGGEYVTDVLWGDIGLQQAKLLCNELSKRCNVNKLCGVHAHLGGVDFNKENIVLMYWLYQKMEPTIFAMLPKSRRNNEYCRPLPPLKISLQNVQSNRDYYINLYYNQIINILSQSGDAGEHINKKKDHPKGFKCGYDHSAARYCWVNFIPAVFDTRKTSRRVPGLEGHFTSPVQTIEFRPHSATTSYIKVKNWLFICIALVDIIDNFKSALYSNTDITLNEIIQLVYPKNHLELNNYIAKRTMKFSDEQISKGLDQETIDHTDNEVDTDTSIKNL
jgi:putative amidoligase enzyme